MSRKTLVRILYGVAGLMFLGITAYQYAQAGPTGDSILTTAVGVTMLVLAVTGKG